MKHVLYGFLLALFLAASTVVTYQIYNDHKLVKATATYLFSETEVKDKNGKPLSRADLIDAILRDAIAKAK